MKYSKKYANTADVKLLNIITTLTESYHSLDHEYALLTEEQYKVIDNRRASHLKEESASYT